jgi:quercetin dioxygenase-like cupin family protein
VLRGSLELDRGDHHDVLPAGSAFYVPPGEPEHRFAGAGPSLTVVFAPLPPDSPRTPRAIDEAILRVGFEALGNAPRALSGLPRDEVRVVGTPPPLPVRHSRIEAEAVLMGPWVYCLAHMGQASGYANSWCDVPHWGIVMSGGIAIEWEDDVEVLGPGDLFYCQAGPPGHRIEAPDGATIIDFTPVESLRARGLRVSEWRPRLEQLAGPESGDEGEPPAA